MIPESIRLRFTVALPEEQKECKKTCIKWGKDKLSAKSCKVQINTDLAEYMRHRDICKL